MTNSLGDEPIPAKESGEMDENTRAEIGRASCRERV